MLFRSVALGGTTYTGPKTLGEFAPELRGQVDTAQRYAEQLGSEAGRRGLLTEGIARQPGAYGQGAATLDEALISGVGNNRERFGDTSRLYGRLGEWLGQREAQAADIATKAADRTATEAGKFRQQVADFDAATAADAAEDKAAGDRLRNSSYGKQPELMAGFEEFRKANGRWPNGAEQTAIVRRVKGF